ncbi:MAG: serine/threonine protein kinase [Deltaproteobacteria bacterium]|nr:serine/threonine protein kinase [Deltaproteobacteria bacterium]
MLDARREGAPIDRYVVNEYLSEGGMGAIYLGKKLGAGGFEKEVVLKQLLPEFTQQPEFIDLFLREARLSASLDHANIIHTIDLVAAGAEYFIVMEYLAGADLRTLLKRAKRRRRRFSAAAGIFVAREVLSALAYAHSKRGPDGSPLELIHRDVSPSNILISYNGEVKLTDFGIAKASTHHSVFYRVKGKVGYMSPEQARSEPLDHRSDLYSLAVCLYEMIAGERLFVHVGLTSSADEIYSQPVPVLSRKIPGLPADLDKVMLRALAIDPNARYQTANELQEALLRCAHKNGLMLSAPELANQLRDVCGPAGEWRDVEGREPTGTAALGGGGTEVYDIEEGTEQLDDDDLADEGDLVSVVRDLSARNASLGEVVPRRRLKPPTLPVELGKLQGLELTSMIKIGGPAKNEGARPLVDLDQLPPHKRTGEVSTISPLADAIDDASVVARPPTAAMPPAQRRPPPVQDPRTETVPPFRSRAPRLRQALAVVGLLALGTAIAVAIGLTGPTVSTAARPAGAPAPTSGSVANPP